MKQNKISKWIPIILVVGLILLILLFLLGPKIIQRYTPTKEHMNLSEYYDLKSEDEVAIILNHTVQDSYAAMIDGALYLDYKFVHDVLNPRFYWDANENILLYTTSSDIISAKAGQTEYTIGKSKRDYDRIIVKPSSNSAWIDLEFVKSYSDFTIEQYHSPSRIVITNEWKDVTVSTLKTNTSLRYRGGIKSPILCDLKKGDTLTILNVDKKWTKVCSHDGMIGYVRSNKIKRTETKTLTSSFSKESFHHITKDEPINFLWHPVYSKAANSEIYSLLSTTKGVNVISPSWFKLKDNKGNISSLASTDYVNYCHNHDVEVWGMVKNMDLASSSIDVNYILTHTSSRQNLVNQIISQALQYHLDGINIDFEQLSESKIGDAYIQFLRELSIKCENNDIILSTSVPTPAAYNNVYKYKEQAYFVDYICLMAYDQHYGQASGEGSVAGLDWVEEGILNTLKADVPSNQLILGIPFYTKLWKLTPTSEDSETERSYMIAFENLGLESSKKWMNETIESPVWLESLGQYYGESTKDGIIYKMWLEDSTSIAEKLKLMKEYKLAGAAFWSSALDTETIWETIIKYIN